jgi:phosphinothricin acetyltransferase
MNFKIRKVEANDGPAVIGIFNYFIENSFAAYPEKALPPEFFGKMLEMARGGSFYVAEAPDGKIAGFSFLKKYGTLPTFDRAAEVTYFIMPECVRKGIGAKFLEQISSDAKALGVDTLLASISSLNANSIEFHRSQGFAECGRFKQIGKKKEKDFDVVWMQKFI